MPDPKNFLNPAHSSLTKPLDTNKLYSQPVLWLDYDWMMEGFGLYYWQRGEISISQKLLQTGLKPKRPSIPWVLKANFPGFKQSGHETDQLYPSNSEVKNAWWYAFITQTPLCRGTVKSDTTPSSLPLYGHLHSYNKD